MNMKVFDNSGEEFDVLNFQRMLNS